MRVLVLGGTRFIGPFVVRRLAEEGHEVTVFHRGGHEHELPNGVEHVHGDRVDFGAFAPILVSRKPEVVIDTLAMTEAAAREVCKTFHEVAQRLVLLSSADVYQAYGRIHRTEPGPPLPVPLDEESPLREVLYPYRGESFASVDAYFSIDDYDKILVERAAEADAGLPTTVLRLPAVIGPGDYQHRLWPELRRMIDGRPAVVLGESQARWRFAYGYVENVADAIALAAVDERAAGRVYNVGEREAPSHTELVEAVAGIVGWGGRVLVVPDEEAPRAPVDVDLSQDLLVDTTRIRSELGYSERVPWEEGLRRAVEWEREHPPDRSPSIAGAEDGGQAVPDYATEDALIAKYG
jgi:nucleoside-diphosphate-sugar epimerase